MNWPRSRGTATAFPLAGFGLSAFFFSVLSSLAFPDGAGGFLLALSGGTFLMILLSSFALRTVPITAGYTALPTRPDSKGRSNSSTLLRTKSASSRSSKQDLTPEPGTQYAAVSGANSSRSSVVEEDCDTEVPKKAKSDAEDFCHRDIEAGESKTAHESLYADVRGLAMVKYSEFYELFLLIGMLTGIGLMTIK